MKRSTPRSNPEHLRNFLEACDNLNITEVNKQLAQPIPKDIISQGMHIIIEKAEKGDRSIECLQTLLDYGGNLEYINKGKFKILLGRTMLIVAAEQKNPSIVSWLLDKGIDVNQLDEEGNTALDISVRNKDNPYSDCVRLLVKAGASLNTQGKPRQILSPVILPPNF